MEWRCSQRYDNIKQTKEECALYAGKNKRDEPTDNVIKEFMQYKNIADPAIARNYFNTRCSKCGEKLKKDETAMSMKFHGRETDTFFCKKCFCNAYNIDKDKYNWYVDRFKTDGCCLF